MSFAPRPAALRRWRTALSALIAPATPPPSDVARAMARAEGIQAIAAALGSAIGIDDVVRVAVREGLARLGAGRGLVALLDPDGHTIRPAWQIGFPTDVIGSWPAFDLADQVPMSEAMRLGEPMIIDSAHALAARYPSLAIDGGKGGPAVVVPLLHERRAIGALYFRFDGPTAISEADRPYLESLAGQCALAIERARLFDAQAAAWAEARRGQERIAFLAQVGEALAAAPDVETAMRKITALAVPEIADWAAVFLRHGDELRPVAVHHDEPNELDAVRSFLLARPPTLHDKTGVGAAIASGHVELEPDYRPIIARAAPDSEAARVFAGLDLRSVMHCPLIGDDATFGSVTLATVGNRTFGEADRQFGEELGRRVGSALDNVRLNARVRDRLRREQAIARIGQQALEHPELDGLFQAVSDELAEVLGADVVSIHELLPDRPVLRIVGGHGWRPGIVGGSEIPANTRSQAGYAIATDASVVSADYERERRFRPSPLILDHGARSGVTTPIRSSRGAWGAIGAYSSVANRFDPDEVAFLEAMANVLGSAIGRRSVEERLEQLVDAERRASELGQAFIGVVSHELRTPITSIYAGTKLLRRMTGRAGDERLEDLTADIEAEADRLYRLTEDLLVLTRVERGRLEIGTEPLVISIIVERVVANERGRSVGHTIEVETASDLPIVSGDATYVEQLIRNLVGNAAKYSPVGSTIRVVVSSESPTEVAVRVLDEGEGLADEDAGRLFQLFYRSPRTAKKAPGAGIGLYVTDQLARAMGGRTWARNRPDGGSEFGFALAVHVPEGEEPRSGGGGSAGTERETAGRARSGRAAPDLPEVVQAP
jgi:signal transduction histidine kinase